MLPARVQSAGLICVELTEELRLELYGCRKFYTLKVYIERLFACIVIQTSSVAAHWCHLLAGENERTPIIQGKKNTRRGLNICSGFIVRSGLGCGQNVGHSFCITAGS